MVMTHLLDETLKAFLKIAWDCFLGFVLVVFETKSYYIALGGLVLDL